MRALLPAQAVSSGHRWRQPTRFRRTSREPVADIWRRVSIRLPILLGLVFACVGPGSASEPIIEFAELESRGVLVVRQLPSWQLERIASRRDDPAWKRVLAVYTGKPDGDRPAMLGELKLEGAELWFRPRFPLQAGVEYHAVFDPRVLGDAGGSKDGEENEARVVTRAFTLPKPEYPVTRVSAVYPSADRLPENQLKFYLHFSAPMRRGVAYRHVRLVGESGREVELPFLELDEELWDPSGRRLTLFFDPGRVKRGLKPREEEGPILEEGHRYALVVDPRWPDAHGNPLKAGVEKSFLAEPPDDVQPRLTDWKVVSPAAGTREPLKLKFPEPLDHGMLERVLRVVNAQSEEVDGEVTVAGKETTWTLVPHGPWAVGRYQVEVDSALEDLAGNSLLRPFEVDVFRSIEQSSAAPVLSLSFECR